MPDDKPLDTKQLMRLLKENASFDKVMEVAGDAMGGITLTSCLLKHLHDSGLTIAQAADAAMLSQSFAYQVFSGARKPGRNTLISIALALGFNLHDTQRLLILAQRGELYPRVRRDAAIIYAMEHGFKLSQAEELLREIGEESLLPRPFQACP